MAIPIVCAQCGKSFEVLESRAGQFGTCTCGARIQIPFPAVKPDAQPASPGPTRGPRKCPKCGTALPLGSARCLKCSPQSAYSGTIGQFGLPTPLAVMIVLFDVVAGMVGLLASLFSLIFLSMGAMSPIALIGFAGVTLVLIVTVLISAGVIVVSVHLWRGERWARLAMMCLVALLGFVHTWRILASQYRPSLFSVLLLILAAVFVVMLNMRSTIEYCSD